MTAHHAAPDSPSRSARWGAIYLALQALGATFWWLMLWRVPESRAWFRPHAAPDSALLSFFLPDAIGFIGLGIWAAIALWRDARHAVLPLALHVGATTYAALYCLQQWLLTGEAGLAALLMLPALVVGPWLLWIGSRA